MSPIRSRRRRFFIIVTITLGITLCLIFILKFINNTPKVTASESDANLSSNVLGFLSTGNALAATPSVENVFISPTPQRNGAKMASVSLGLTQVISTSVSEVSSTETQKTSVESSTESAEETDSENTQSGLLLLSDLREKQVKVNAKVAILGNFLVSNDFSGIYELMAEELKSYYQGPFDLFESLPDGFGIVGYDTVSDPKIEGVFASVVVRIVKTNAEIEEIEVIFHLENGDWFLLGTI